MKTAYLDCASGISGDMTLGALVDAGADLAEINSGVQSLGLPNVHIVAEEVKKHGFRALQITVQHEPEHKHRHLHHIEEMIAGSALKARQQELALAIFRRLGAAEAKVHGVTVRQVHFHEVGAVDSIADIVGAAIAFDLLGIEHVVASPIPTGCGFIEIAHGRVSVPAPAAAELLAGVPLAQSHVEAELTTPTGAAIVAALAKAFGPLPAMSISAIGYGAGQRELEEHPNLLRVMIGDSSGGPDLSRLSMVETNIDDAGGELIGHCAELLWQAGALDVYFTPIQMKKNRPGVKVSVLCPAAILPEVQKILFAETTTLGVRRWQVDREVLQRKTMEVQTQWGPVQGIISALEGSPPRFSPEYESCRKVAHAQGVPLRDVYDSAVRAFDPATVDV